MISQQITDGIPGVMTREFNLLVDGEATFARLIVTDDGASFTVQGEPATASDWLDAQEIVREEMRVQRLAREARSCEGFAQ
jgi:hypothetical protein